MRILVTGGAGFIGSHVCERLLAADHEVAALDDLSVGKREHLAPAVVFYQVDLCDREATARAISDFRPEVVSHQAAQVSVSVSVREPALDARINVLGGINLLDACSSTGVARFVFASSGGAIYGEIPEGELAREELVPRPISPYAIHKLSFELLLGVYRRERGLTSTILRYGNVYGPRQDPYGEAGVIAIFLDRALRGATLDVNGRSALGDDGCVRDYVFVEDVARINLLAAEGKLSHGLMNVGTGIGTPTQRLAERITREAQSTSRIEPAPPRPGDVGRSVLDARRTVEALGTITGLDEGLAKTSAWFRSRH
jgi:UDP-glucose 4-epimerase